MASASGGWLFQRVELPGQRSRRCPPARGTWYHVTATAGNDQFYVDGQPVGAAYTQSGTPQLVGSDDLTTTPTYDLSIGAYNGSQDAIGGTSFSDFQLYGSVLTAAQVYQLYQTDLVPLGTSLPSGSPVQMGAGVLDLAGVNQTVASLADLSGGGTGTVTSSVAGAVTLTLAPPSASTTTFSGVIQDGSGTMALVMNGPGTQVLAGSNTYSGGTTIPAACSPSAMTTTSAPPAARWPSPAAPCRPPARVTLNPTRPLSVGPAAGIDIPSGSALVIPGTITNAGSGAGNLTVTGAAAAASCNSTAPPATPA